MLKYFLKFCNSHSPRNEKKKQHTTNKQIPDGFYTVKSMKYFLSAQSSDSSNPNVNL